MCTMNREPWNHDETIMKHETMKQANLKHDFLWKSWCGCQAAVFGKFNLNLVPRTYHQRFGIHLATLKKEMGEANWKAACWLVTLVLFFCYLTAGQARPEPPALPGLDAGKTDVELFKDCMATFSFWSLWLFLERGNRLVHGWCLGRCQAPRLASPSAYIYVSW